MIWKQWLEWKDMKNTFESLNCPDYSKYYLIRIIASEGGKGHQAKLDDKGEGHQLKKPNFCSMWDSWLIKPPNKLLKVLKPVK